MKTVDLRSDPGHYQIANFEDSSDGLNANWPLKNSINQWFEILTNNIFTSNVVIKELSVVNDIQQFETSSNNLLILSQIANQVLFKLNEIKTL